MNNLICLMAGEASGDIFLADVMKHMRRYNPSVRFVGVGGERMHEQGLITPIPVPQGYMGVVELLPHLWKFRRSLYAWIDFLIQEPPCALLTADSGGFHFALGKRLAKATGRLGYKIPHAHLVAPQVWAWRKGRARKMASFLDHLFCLLPFEPPLFTKHGLSTTFVGHPFVEQTPAPLTVEEISFRKKTLGIPENYLCLGVFFGSRAMEWDQLSKIFTETLYAFSQKQTYHLIIPTFEAWAPRIREFLKDFPGSYTLTTTFKEKTYVWPLIDRALAASGTVTLELALSGIPTVVGYRISPLTYAVVKKVIKVDHIALPNILWKERIFEECIQDRCTVQNLLQALQKTSSQSVLTDERTLFLKNLLRNPRGCSASKDIAEWVMNAIPPCSKPSFSPTTE